MNKKELTRITREVYNKYKPGFAGYCARASMELVRRLLEAGVHHTAVLLVIEERRDCAHVYVRCGDYYLDPTQEQFGRRGVWVSKDRPPMDSSWRLRSMIPIGVHLEDRVWQWFHAWRTKYRPTMQVTRAIVRLVRKQQKQRFESMVNYLKGE